MANSLLDRRRDNIYVIPTSGYHYFMHSKNWVKNVKESAAKGRSYKGKTSFKTAAYLDLSSTQSDTLQSPFVHVQVSTSLHINPTIGRL